MIVITKESLNAEVVEAKRELANREAALAAFIAAPENNVFTTLEEAENELYERLRNIAHEDCEGAGNCGNEEYEQGFIVDGIHYEGKLTVEYDRHDKTYYYIDRAKFTYEPVDRDGS